MADTLCHYSLSRTTSAEPRRCVAPQLPRPSPDIGSSRWPSCTAPPRPCHVRTHKQTQTHNTHRVWVHKSCWTKNINSTLQWFICFNIIYVQGTYLFKYIYVDDTYALIESKLVLDTSHPKETCIRLEIHLIKRALLDDSLLSKFSMLGVYI